VPRRAASTVLGLAIAISATQLPITDASAVTVRTFANCTAMHRVYKHGVGRRNAHDHTSGTPVTNFYRNQLLSQQCALLREPQG